MTPITQIDVFLNNLLKINQNYDIEKIRIAYLYAEEIHSGQFRKSGEAYISHPLEVANIVASLELDTDSICAALLHDTIEDHPEKATLSDIKQRFGANVAELVDGLTKLVAIPFDDKEEEHIENLRKMFLAMSKDLRVIFIKLCDRLHNMRTLSSHTEEKQRLIALETMHVYAPLAHRLGMQKIKQELERHALLYLDPVGYNEIKTCIDEKYGENRDFLEKAQSSICDKLNEQGIHFGIEGRVKSIYSMYKKMYTKNKSFDEIYDFYAVRVIVDDELTCYTVLGIIHELFNSVPGRFKDYISMPKANMYKSIHTTVMSRDGIPFEVQIRTWQMHKTAEYGLAAHWQYKSNLTKDEALTKKLEWIHTLLENEKEAAEDSDDYLRPLKIDLFEDEIFVFTPKGDVIDLPVGSTPIDFAYAIHTAVGNKMIGAKINGVIAPIDTELQTGQIVDIITSSSSKGPNRDWIKIVKTSEARNKIKQWFKKEKREENIENAQKDIEKLFRKFGLQFNDEQRDAAVLAVAERMSLTDVDDFYNAIGYGGISLSKVENKLKTEFEKLVRPEESAKPEIKIVDTAKKPKSSLPHSQTVIIEGVDNCQVKFAKCCNPLPGDKIVGFITRGSGVSVHKRDCPNVISGFNKPEKADRFISIFWEEAPEDKKTEGLYESFIQVFAENDIQLLANITSVIAEMRVMLYQINTHSRDNDITVNLVVGCKNIDHFQSIMARLRTIDHVFDVRRGYM